MATVVTRLALKLGNFSQVSSVAGFVHGVVRGDVENVGVRWMERDRDDRLAVLCAAEAEEEKGEGGELSDGSK